MDTWILQKGYPLLEVTDRAEGVEITQRRHLKIPAEDPTLWRIPMQLRGRTAEGLFHTRTLAVEPNSLVAVGTPLEWLTANAGGHGFYRVGYSSRLWKSLLRNLHELDDLERFCLIDDAWALVESGEMSAPSYLDLAASYRDETEFAIWSALVGGLGAIDHHLVGQNEREKFSGLVMELIEPSLARLGWAPDPDDSDLTRQLRGLILGGAGRLARHPDYVTRSRETFEKWLSDRRAVDPEVAETCLYTVAAHGDTDTYHRLYSLYEEEESPQDKLRLLRSVTFVETEAGVDAILRAVLDKGIRNQDAAWVVGWLFRRKRTGAYAWARAEELWADIVAYVPPMTVRFLVDSIWMSDPQVADRVTAFLSETDLPHAEKATAQALERLRAYVSLRERQTPVLRAYLRELGGVPA